MLRGTVKQSKQHVDNYLSPYHLFFSGTSDKYFHTMENHNNQRRCIFPGPFILFKICLLLTLPYTFFIITKLAYIDHSMPFLFEKMLRVGGSLETLVYYTDSQRFTYACQRELLHKLEHFARYNQTVPIPTSRNQTCPRQLQRPREPLPLTALLSFPGSGNTWTRHLLQQLTGLYTGSIYKDPVLVYNGFPFEGFIKRVIVVKTHGSLHRMVPHYVPIDKFDRVILILRNVYECILSDVRRILRRNSHTATIHVNTTKFPWQPFLMTYLQNWEQFMREAFTFRGPMLVVFYEDLKSKFLPQLIRMADFLR